MPRPCQASAAPARTRTQAGRPGRPASQRRTASTRRRRRRRAAARGRTRRCVPPRRPPPRGAAAARTDRRRTAGPAPPACAAAQQLPECPGIGAPGNRHADPTMAMAGSRSVVIAHCSSHTRCEKPRPTGLIDAFNEKRRPQPAVAAPGALTRGRKQAQVRSRFFTAAGDAGADADDAGLALRTKNPMMRASAKSAMAQVHTFCEADATASMYADRWPATCSGPGFR